MVVRVADNQTLYTEVYSGCTREISGLEFSIDLIPIAMREVCVTVDMDWLDTFEAEISCHRAAPVAKASYHLTPPEMKELHSHLQELSDKDTYLLDSEPAAVMFDSSATHSLVFRTFINLLGRSIRKFARPMIVEVAENLTIYVTDVYRGYTLEFSGVEFFIDLIPIAIRELCVIVGMDWLDAFDAKIHCRKKQIRVQNPRGGELIIPGDIPRQALACYSSAVTLVDIPIVSDFSDVFSEELPSLSPIRQVEFRLDLVPDATLSEVVMRDAVLGSAMVEDMFINREFVDVFQDDPRMDALLETFWEHHGSQGAVSALVFTDNKFHMPIFGDNISHQLRKCVVDDTMVVPLEDIQIDERLNYVEQPVAILDRETKTLRNKTINLVKV
ncbi:hypothetical protein L1887_43158 [Cichorium endivia]|nr:hypothetical protein L1887_43158 [Cichorium endivia]